jgi:hypothetical protein
MCILSFRMLHMTNELAEKLLEKCKVIKFSIQHVNTFYDPNEFLHPSLRVWCTKLNKIAEAGDTLISVRHLWDL